MTDTEMAEGTRHPVVRRAFRRPSRSAARILCALCVASLLCTGTRVERATAEPAPLDARVAWVRGQRVYIASHDSLTLAPFSLLTVTSGGRAIATAEVERLVDGGLAIARITSGSLARVKRLDRLRILAERPRGPRVLRVGYPSEKRSTQLFACDEQRFAPPLPPGSYRIEGGPGDGSGYRLLLLPPPDSVRAVPWPETLLVRLFDDAADQEIAVERGELDVAVFRPGELSTHMREHPGWKDRLSAVPSRGIIGSIRMPADPTETRCAAARQEARAFGALDRALFRGDLVVLSERDSIEWCADSPGARDAGSVRYEVDPSCPGRAALERFLDRFAPAERAGDPPPVVRLFYLDTRPSHPAEMALAAADHVRQGPYPPGLRARADSLAAILRRGNDPAPGWPGDLAWEWLGLSFAISPGYQVLCEPRSLPYVRALGANAFVDLFVCSGPGRKP